MVYSRQLNRSQFSVTANTNNPIENSVRAGDRLREREGEGERKREVAQLKEGEEENGEVKEELEMVLDGCVFYSAFFFFNFY